MHSEPLMTPEERDQLEGNYVVERIIQLECFPLRGKFDAAHLRKINEYIFQDLPGAGFDNVTPGKFRPSIPADQDWIKLRGLSTVNTSYVVAYSRMDKEAQKRLDDVLKGVKPDELRKLPKKEFAKRLSNLYVELDYIHPFSDGNSRTLRTFTRQLARECGYDLDWTRLGRSPQGRDMLYIARDLSVNQLAKPHLRDFETKRNVDHTELILSGNRDLNALLPELVRPSRAKAFERVVTKQLYEAEALQAYPELKDAFDTLHDASSYFAGRMSDLDAQQVGMKQVVQRVQDGLNAGETVFGRNREGAKVQPREKQAALDKDYDR